MSEESKKGIYDQSSFDAIKPRLNGINQNIPRRLWKIETTHRGVATHSLKTTELEGAVATPLIFNQPELFDMIRDLKLAKETSEVIASWMHEKNFQRGTGITFYRTRGKALLPYFPRENNLVFCNDVGVFNKKLE